jgi:hypothetical protein
MRLLKSICRLIGYQSIKNLVFKTFGTPLEFELNAILITDFKFKLWDGLLPLIDIPAGPVFNYV